MDKYKDILHTLAYNIDASHIDNNASIEVFIPSNIDEVKEVVSEAILKNKKIILRGGGTNLVGNCLPTEGSFVLDISKINHIGEIKNNTITVGPGVIGDDLNSYLKDFDLEFPVILGSHSGAQIGGMVATNGAGMKAIKYGKMESWVESLEVLLVDRDKKIVIKTLSGSDMFDFLGSEGLFGIILNVGLKLISLKTNKTISFYKFDNLRDLVSKVELIKKDLTNIEAIEYVDKITSKMLGFEEKYNLFIEYSNDDGEIKDTEEIEKIWFLRDSCYSVLVNNSYELIEDPKVNIENSKKLLQWFEDNCIPVFGHIGTGIFHPHFKKDQEDLIGKMYKIVKDLGGDVSGEHGIGIKKKQFLSSGEKQKYIDLKNKLDPNNIFGGDSVI